MPYREPTLIPPVPPTPVPRTPLRWGWVLFTVIVVGVASVTVAGVALGIEKSAREAEEAPLRVSLTRQIGEACAAACESERRRGVCEHECWLDSRG